MIMMLRCILLSVAQHHKPPGLKLEDLLVRNNPILLLPCNKGKGLNLVHTTRHIIFTHFNLPRKKSINALTFDGIYLRFG